MVTNKKIRKIRPEFRPTQREAITQWHSSHSSFLFCCCHFRWSPVAIQEMARSHVSPGNTWSSPWHAQWSLPWWSQESSSVSSFSWTAVLKSSRYR